MQLGEACEIRIGHSDSVFGSASEDQPQSNVNFLTVQAVNNPVSIEWDRLKEYGVAFEKGAPLFLQPGDIVFGHKGKNNRAIHVTEVPERTVACAQLMIIRLVSNAYRPEFIVWWLNQAPAKQFYKQHYRGKTKVHLTLKDLKTLPLPSYTVTEQDAIIAHVQQVELEIQTHHKLIRNRQRYLDGLMQTLVKSTNLDIELPESGGQ